MNVPGNTRATKALSENDEYEVKQADVLVFDNSQDGAGKFLYYAYGKNKIEDISSGSDRKIRFNVDLQKDPLIERYDIMILTNCREAIQSAGLTAGMTREQVQKAITVSVAATQGWISKTSTTGYKAMPMWGEMKYQKISVEENYNVSVMRMVAKIDLSVALDAVKHDPADIFVIEEVKLYNYHTKGYVIPADGTLGVNAQGKTTVTTPTPHSASKVTGAANKIDYSSMLSSGKLEREIYTFEAPAGSTSDYENNICLVFKGTFTPKDGVAQTGWYRLDFANKADDLTAEYISIKRNHRYNVVITMISGKGYDDEKTAYESLPANISNSILEWNDGGLGDIIYDGNYYLSIRPGSELEFHKEPDTQTTKIKTDYPKGWKITRITSLNADGVTQTDISDGGWLTTDKIIDTFYGSGEVEVPLNITVTDNDSGKERTGYIYIKAGRFEGKLTVTQSTVSQILMRVDDVTNAATPKIDIAGLTFPSGLWAADPITAKSVAVNWVPYIGNNPCSSIAMEMTGGGFQWGAGTAMPGGNTSLTSATGVITYANIKPNNFAAGDVASPNEFLERSTMYTYTVSDGIDTKAKILMMRQVHYNAVADISDYYLMNSTEHSFKVRSNSSWKIELDRVESNGVAITPTTKVVTSFSVVNGGYDTKPGGGTEVKFKLDDKIGSGNIDITQADVFFKITCTDPERKFDPIIVKVNALAGIVREVSNCYIVAPNSAPILIPVKRANGIMVDGTSTQPNWNLGTQITKTGAATDKYGTKLVWTDTPNGAMTSGLGADAAIKMTMIAGSNSDGYILVMPGSRSGNAVVAITRTPNVGAAEGTGDILWSFHIWVTDYWPYDTNGDAHGNPQDGNDKRKLWMDRNLGATANGFQADGTTPETVAAELVKAYGNYYQWGRKDPFPGAKTANDANNTPGRDVYDANGKINALPAWVNGNTLLNSVQNPLKEITDWSGVSNAAAPALSWTTIDNPETGLKTAYDPCPEGWRVPIRNASLTWNDAGNSKHWGNESNNMWAAMSTQLGGFANYGVRLWASGSLPYKGGYYPAVGYRTYGALSIVGLHGYYWSATYTGAGAMSFYFTNGSVIPGGNGLRPVGFAVRCVAE